MGDHVLDYFIEQQPDYLALPQAADKQAMKDKAFEQWTAYLLIKNAEWRKYGSILTDLKGSFVKKRDEYPRTFEQAIDLLEQHSPDQAWKDYRKSQAKNDKNKEKHGSSFNQQSKTKGKQKSDSEDYTCFVCGSKEHKKPDCKWTDKIPKNDWWQTTKKIPSMVSRAYAQSESGADDTDTDADADDDSSIASARSTQSSRSQSRYRRSGRGTRNRDEDWSASHFMTQLHQTDTSDMKDVIILDTGSTIGATFMNPDLITDLHHSKQALKMSTNAGTRTIQLKGTVPGLGDAWCDPDMMADIFGFLGAWFSGC